MQKSLFSASALLLIVLLAGADYMLNFRGQLTLQTPESLMPAAEEGIPLEVQVVGGGKKTEGVVSGLLQDASLQQSYAVASRQQAYQLFDRFDLTPLTGLLIYRNDLTSALAEGVGDSLTVYEIQAAQGQGSLAYLNIKLALVSQLPSPDQLNEVTGYGQNALFYNAPDLPDTGFLLSQQGDYLLAFHYSKKSLTALPTVLGMIESLSKQL